MSRAVGFKPVGGTELLVPVDEKGECAPTVCGRCGHNAGFFRNTGGITICAQCPVDVVTLTHAQIAEIIAEAGGAR